LKSGEIGQRGRKEALVTSGRYRWAQRVTGTVGNVVRDEGATDIAMQKPQANGCPEEGSVHCPNGVLENPIMRSCMKEGLLSLLVNLEDGGSLFL
jgi:hypothetical protein